MKLTSTLVTNAQATPFTYINILRCVECNNYEVDMTQTKRVESDDLHLFHNNVPIFTAHSLCWDCYCNS